MAKNLKRRFTVSLDIDTKKAEKQIQVTTQNLKTILADMTTAADKMTYFKELVDYLQQVDASIGRLKQKHGEGFVNQIFGNMDTNLRNEMENVFGVARKELETLNTLRAKINNVDATSATADDIKALEQEVRALFSAIGQEDKVKLSGKGALETRLGKMKDALNEFAMVFDSVNDKISQGFGFGGHGDPSGEVKKEIEELEKQQKKYQEIVDAFNKKPIKIEVNKSNDIKIVKQLIAEYKTAKAELDKLEKGSEAYRKKQLEAYRAAVLLKNTDASVGDDGSDDYYDLDRGVIKQATAFMGDVEYDMGVHSSALKAALQSYVDSIAEISGKLSQLKINMPGANNGTITLYDKLNQKVAEYNRLVQERNKYNEDTPEYDRLQAELDEIFESMKKLKTLNEGDTWSLKDILVDLGDEYIEVDTALKGVCDLFGVEIPKSMQNANKHTSDTAEHIRSITLALKEMHAAAGRSADFEYHLAMDGLDIKARHGAEKSVDVATQTESYLDYLFSDSVLYGHSHRGGTSETNISDITSVLSTYKEGVSIPVHFVVGKDAITTIDFTGVSRDMVDQLLQEINATGLAKNAPVSHDIINKIAEKFTGKTGALKTWNIDQFDDLAQYLHDVSSAATSTLTPIEKFQAILNNMFGKGKVDASKYETLLSGLNKDNAKSIFNQIASMEKLQPIKTTDMLTMGQVNAEIDESIAKYKTLREEANLSYADIRNEVDKVIEHYKNGGSVTKGLDFFQQYFPEGEWQNVRNLLTDAYGNLISIEEVTNRIANEFGVDPDTFAQIPTGTHTGGFKENQIEDATVKLKEFLALTDEIKAKTFDDYFNAEDNVEIGKYTERLEQAKIALDLLGDQGALTAEQIDQVNDAFNIAKSKLQGSTYTYDGYGHGSYTYSYEDEYEEAQKQNRQLQDENESLKDQLARQSRGQNDVADDYYDEELSDIQRENGALEDRLEILRDIAEEYGSQMTQKKRDRYEELNQKSLNDELTTKEEDRYWELGEEIAHADEALESFGATYDKIILKLGNGKKVEILPDDAGLRKLYDFSDGWGNEYKGVEIEDVQFIRKAAQQTSELKNVTMAAGAAVDNLSNKNQVGFNNQADQIERAKIKLQEFFALTEKINNEKFLIDSQAGEYIGQLELMEKELQELAQDGLIAAESIEKIDQAFSSSRKHLYDTLDYNRTRRAEEDAYAQGEKEYYERVLDSEAQARREVESQLSDAQADALRYEESANRLLEEKFALQKENEDLREQLAKQTAEEFKQEGQIVDQVVTDEISSLSHLIEYVNQVKAAVQAKTKAFYDEGTVVGQTVGKEIAALIRLVDVLNNVEAKINSISQGFKNTHINVPTVNTGDQQIGQAETVENPHYVTDPQGKPVIMYRGIHNAYGGLVSNRYHGGTFSTDNLDLAKEYAGDIGKIEKVLLAMKNPLEIDGQGAYWNQIEYIGDNADEASQKLHDLNADIRALTELLKEAEQIPISDKEQQKIDRGFMLESDTRRARDVRYYSQELNKAKAEKEAILADSGNPYGKYNTNEIVEIAKSKGYDGVIFKNIIDSATGDIKDLSNVMVTFTQDQIHYLETIESTFESAILNFKNHFKDLTQHVDATDVEVRDAITKTIEMRSKFNAGEITQKDYDDFTAQNAIARDFDLLADRTRLSSDFITEALQGDRFNINTLVDGVNQFIADMRNRLQKIATAFNMEDVPLSELVSKTQETTVSDVVDNNVPKSPNQGYALESTLGTVKGVLDNILKAIQLNDGSTKKNNELSKAATALQNAANKLVAYQPAESQEQPIIPVPGTSGTSGKKDAGPKDTFSQSLSNQKTAFSEYRKELEQVDYLNDELKQDLDELAVKLRTISDAKGLGAWRQEFSNLQKEVGKAKSAFTAAEKDKISPIRAQLNAEFKNIGFTPASTDLTGEQKELLSLRQQLIVQLDTYSSSVEKGKRVELTSINEAMALLRQKIALYRENNKLVSESAQKFGAQAALTATAKYNSLQQKASSGEYANSHVVQQEMQKYKAAYDALIAKRKELAQVEGTLSDEQKAAFKQLQTECNQYARSITKIIDSSEKLKSSGFESLSLDESIDDKDIKGRQKALKDFVETTYGADAKIGNFKDNFNKLLFTLDNGDGTFTQMTASLNAAKTAIVATAGETKKATGIFESFFHELKGKFRTIFTYLTASFGWQEIFQQLRRGVQYVREIDSALTELKKVTDETNAAYDEFLQTASKTANALGTTVSDFVNATADFARLGYDIAEAADLASAASVYKNVGDGLSDINAASESIISTMKAFGVEANNAMGIVDRFNEVGNNFAISSTGIGEALQRSASALYEAGNTIDESIALVTGANSVIQNPEQVGTALKTLALRLRGAKVELEEAGLESDNMAESTSQLQAKLKALTHGKVDIMLDPNTFKNTTQILREMSMAWEDMTDIERASALELMGGKRQANILASLIKNFETVEDVINTSANSAGSALLENEKYLDSIQGKIDVFKNTLQTVWMNFLNDDVVKFVVDLGTALLKLVDTMGVVPSAIGGFMSFRSVLKDIKTEFEAINTDSSKIIEIFKTKPQNTNVISDVIDNATDVSPMSDAEQLTLFDVDNIEEGTEAINKSTTAKQINTVATYESTEAGQIAGQMSLFEAQGEQESAIATDQDTASKIRNKAATVANTVATKALVAVQALAKGALIGLASVAVTKALSVVLSGINDIIHAEERAIERTNEAINNYAVETKKLKDQKKEVDELAASYSELSSGVNTTTNSNIGLTTEAYKEYLDVCNQIADMYPELVTGYDVQGNAILSLKGKVDELTAAYLRANEAAALEFLSADNKEDVWKTYEANIIKEKGQGFKSTIPRQQAMLEAVKSMTTNDLAEFYKYDSAGNVAMWDILREQLQKNGTYIDDQDMYSAFNSMYLDFDTLDEYKAGINEKLTQINKDVAAGMNGIKETVNANLIFDSMYQQLDDQGKEFAKTMVNNITPEMVANSGAANTDEFLKWFSDSVLTSIDAFGTERLKYFTTMSDQIAKAMSSGDATAFNEAALKFYNNTPQAWRDGATGEIVVDKNADIVTQYLQQMAKDIEEQSKNYEVQLKFKHDFDYRLTTDQILTDSVGEISEELSNEIKETFANLDLGDNATIKDVYEKISTTLAGEDGNLRSDDLSNMYQEWINAGTPDKMDNWSDDQVKSILALDSVIKMYGTDINTVKGQLMELGYVLPSVSDIQMFDLGSEATNEMIEKFQGSIDSIKSAWVSLNSKEMTKSEFIELVQEFPELMDGVNLADDNWIVKAKENLEELNKTKIDEFIATLATARDAMAEQGGDTSVIDSFINYAKQLKEQPLSYVEPTTQPTSITALTTAYENYNAVLKETNEIIFDNQAVSQEYKESLVALGIAEEDLAECFDDTNPLLVKNVKQLKNLVRASKNNIAQNVKLAKSQVSLQYYKKYQELRKLTNGQKVNAVATLNQIKMLYAEMGALDRVIFKYNLLEEQLLGATNAYDKFEAAQEFDASTNYIESAETMVMALGEAFNKATLGSETAQAAIMGLVHPSVYEDLDTVDEKMAAIYKYFKEGKLAQYFDIQFDEKGTIESVEMKLGNLRKFIEDGLLDSGANVFDGADWQHFEFSDEFMQQLNNLPDGADKLQYFADKMEITKEVAFAFIKSLEDHDIEWLNGDYSSMFDTLLPDSLDMDIHDNITALAELEMQLASGEIEADAYREALFGLEGQLQEGKVTQEDYKKAEADLKQQLNDGKITAQEYTEALYGLQGVAQENANKARENATAWFDASNEVNGAKEKVQTLTEELRTLKESGASTVEIQAKTDELVLASNLLSDALQKKYGLEEPTELSIQVAIDEVDKQMELWKSKHSELNVDVVPELVQDDNGQWTIPADVKATLDETEKAAIEEYLALLSDQYTLNILADENPTDSTEELQSIKTAAEEAKKAVEDIPDPKINTQPAINSINSLQTAINNIQGRTVDIYEVTHKKTVYSFGVSGDNQVNGTANVNGTAYASGNWGLPKNEHNALVGELGQEMVVDPQSGRYYTVGDNGAEMVDLPKGAIIFNHKQTEALLSKGRIAGRGKAYAEGNAHLTIWPDGSSKQQWEGTGYSGPDDPTYDLNDALSNAADAISDAADKFEEVFDWIDVRLEEIEEQLSLLNAKLENAVGYLAKNQIIDATINISKSKMKNLQAGLTEYEEYAAKLLTKVPTKYRDAAQNGAIAIEEFAGEADEKTLKAIQDYREWAQKAADMKQQIEELKAEIADLAKQKFDNVADQFDNQISLIEAANDKLDAQISLMEDRGYVAAKEYYETMADNTKKTQAELIKERDILQSVLDEQVKLGNIQVGSDAWYEMVEQLYDVDASIVECTSDLESFQNAINDIYWDNFDELISRYDYLSDETQNLINLMDEADMVSKPDDENGWAANKVEWTKEGIASLGLYAQQMEIAEYKSKQYAKAIEDLNKDYKDGKYSESEYLEKLNELKDAQYDSIEAYYEAQEAIKDLNSQRIDAIKEGIEKEIEAYEELINKQKEALDAEKDMADFQKSVAEQQKNVTDIQRKLDALANDNSISAAAKRKQLQAELAEAEYELEELYNDRSYEDKQNALDKELESFQEQKAKEIEEWEKYLDNIEQVVTESLGIVQANASGIYDTLSGKAEEYNLTLSESITTPWKNGEYAISSYQEVFDTAASSTTDQLAQIKLAWQEVIDVMSEAAEVEIAAQEKANNRHVSTTATSTSSANTTSKPSSNTSSSTTKSTPSVGQTVKVKSSATHFSAQSGNARMASFVPGGTYQVMQVGINGDKSQILIGKNGQYTGWVKLTDLEGYAKGTIGVDNDQFAWLDELGEELVMHADGNGRLSFLTKGTSVIPADITKNLMQLGQLNPQDILDRSRPTISAPHITNNNIELKMDIAEVVHIDTVTNETIPNLTKAIDKQLDKYMKNLNNQVRKYSR